ncbi:DUF99 family protein [Billgrantia sp. LNSP4103-1]|uniref:endonuclease dU n=1 Tax=Billgrantia sp. LNSP4103-1 TaxID=3410266 RepID=UPI00403F3D28
MATPHRQRTFSHIVGFDDCPFPRGLRGDVPIVGTVFSGLRLEGVLSGKVRRDGINSTRELIRLAGSSRFAAHLQLVMLQGVALAGFNVIDVPRLNAELGLPVLVVARRAPRQGAMRRALHERIPGGARKWALVERLGEMEPLEGVYVQRMGLSLVEAATAIRATTPHGNVPEPLRVAHLIAGGVTLGESRGRV